MNKTMGFIRALLAIALLGSQMQATAEDIDLFVGTPAAETDLPNVLIVLDNTANWNTAFANEKAALKAVFDGLPLNRFRVGMMLFGDTDSGFVKAAIRTMDETNRPVYSAMVNGLLNQTLNQGGDRASARTLGRTMSEAHRYLFGLNSVGGASFPLRDFTGNTAGTTVSNAVYALPGNALSSASATTYNGPLSSSSCAKNFIIYIGNTTAGGNVTKDNSARNTLAKNELTNAGGDTTEIPLSPSGFQDNVADEWARFLNQNKGVVTYTVDVNPQNQANGPANSALLKSMAAVGGGKYFAVDSSVGNGAEIADALNNIFSEIQSVNSVFASVSLPVSVNTQGTYLNQVYIGMFRPDPQSRPRWAGNLKQYKLGFVNDTLKLQDANGNGAVNSLTGFITECARSFWTPSTTDSYWGFNPQGACLTVANSAASNYPDGNIVEKGAQAYVLRSDTARTMYTCSPSFSSCGSTSSLSAFNTSNADITQALLGVADSTERTALINWARGLDIDDERQEYGADPNPANTSLMRPSAHGDVVHSRPVAINYGSDASPQVVVFYGGNDGVLRAVNGNRSAAIGSVPAGGELWSFMPPEFYGNLKRIRGNDPAIVYPGSSTVGAQPKGYGFDGPLTAYTASGSTWLYGALRRGGRALYAFDVSNASSPSMKWKVGCPNQANDTNCSTGFSDIGQTWSAPRILRAAGYDSGASPMLIMGGGYDTCEDSDNGTSNHSCGASSKGNKVYVLDADTGARLKTFTTERGVVADVTVVTNADGLATYAYTADLGGNVYRISGIDANTPIAATEPADWTITKVASVGCTAAGSCNANRKFIFAPDIVLDGSTHVLLLGSGDREKPLAYYQAASGVDNYFFMIKDKPSDATWLSSENTTCAADVICLDSLLAVAADGESPAQAAVDAKKGWYLELTSTEQVVTSAITVFGVVTFSTHQPAVATPGQCSNLGMARVYNLEYKNAESTSGGLRYETIVGGGLPPSPVAGMVTLDDGTTVPFIIGGSGDSPLEGGEPPPPPSSTQPKAKVYWNIEQ